MKTQEKAQARRQVPATEIKTLSRVNGQNGKPVKIIAVYNFKGGVGKTTTTINLGAALANEGLRTVVIDADPQCNVTNFFQPPANVAQPNANNEVPDRDEDGGAAAVGQGAMVAAALAAGAGAAAAAAAGVAAPPSIISEYPLPATAASAIEMDYMKVTDERMYNAGILDLYSLLEPPFVGKGYLDLVPPEKLLAIEGVPNMFLVPGSPLLPKLESQLSLVAANSSTASVFLGAFGHMFHDIAQVTEADYIIVDLSPSMSLLNKMIILSCHYVLPPMFADFFSLSSMHTLLSEMVPMLIADHKKIIKDEPERLTNSQKAFGYAFNPKFPKILPFLVTNFGKKERPKGSGNEFVVKQDADWIVSMKAICDPANNFVKKEVTDLFVPSAGNMVVPLVQKFDALNALSHTYGHPACLMDIGYFNRVVVPQEAEAAAAAVPPTAKKPVHWYKATGYDMAAKILTKYQSLVRFLEAI